VIKHSEPSWADQNHPTATQAPTNVQLAGGEAQVSAGEAKIDANSRANIEVRDPEEWLDKKLNRDPLPLTSSTKNPD